MDYLKILEKAWPYDWALSPTVHLGFLKGSRGWGLNKDSSDHDVVFVCIPPSKQILGLDIFDHWRYESEELDATVYSLRKFVTMLIKGNPNMVELVYLDPEFVNFNPFTSFIIENRDKLITKQTVRALINASFGTSPVNPKASHNKDRVEKFGFDVKNAAHSLRWLLFARDLMTTEAPSTTLTGGRRNFIKHVLEGKFSFEEYCTLFKDLLDLVEGEFKTFDAPKEIDRDFFEDKLVETLRIFT